MWEANTDQADSTIHNVPYLDNIGFLETIIKNKTPVLSAKRKNRFLKCSVHYLLLLEK